MGLVVAAQNVQISEAVVGSKQWVVEKKVRSPTCSMAASAKVWIKVKKKIEMSTNQAKVNL